MSSERKGRWPCPTEEELSSSVRYSCKGLLLVRCRCPKDIHVRNGSNRRVLEWYCVRWSNMSRDSSYRWCVYRTRNVHYESSVCERDSWIRAPRCTDMWCIHLCDIFTHVTLLIHIRDITMGICDKPYFGLMCMWTMTQGRVRYEWMLGVPCWLWTCAQGLILLASWFGWCAIDIFVL